MFTCDKSDCLLNRKDKTLPGQKYLFDFFNEITKKKNSTRLINLGHEFACFKINSLKYIFMSTYRSNDHLLLIAIIQLFKDERCCPAFKEYIPDTHLNRISSRSKGYSMMPVVGTLTLRMSCWVGR